MRSFETMQISYFCLNAHPLILAFFLDFACSKLLLGYPDGDFLFLSFLLHSLIGIFLEGRLPLPFFYLLDYLFTSDGLLNIHFTLWTWIQSYYYFICCSSRLNFGHRKFFGVGPWNLPKHLYDSVCLTTCLLSGKGVLRVIFCFPVWDLASTFDYFLMNRCYL